MTLRLGEMLQQVAVRLVSRYLAASGELDVRVATRAGSLGQGVDLSYVRDGVLRRSKVRGDAYFGTDGALIADHCVPFYRADSNSYALETIADAATRVPGWIFTSEADEVLYLFVALRSTEEQVGSVLSASEQVFLERLQVERDALHVLPMEATRAWLSTTQDAYPARPVTSGRATSWVRLVPTNDVAAAVNGVRVLGSILSP